MFYSAPNAGRVFIERALTQAAAVLRPEVDIGATTLSLMGLILMSVIWQARGWLQLSSDAWDATLAAAIRPLFLA
jgi:hypothetical protein